METKEPKMKIFEGPKVDFEETKKMATQEHKLSSQEQKPSPVVQSILPSKYSNRVVLKTLLEREDGGVGLVGQRVVIGGWVKSSMEVKEEPVKPEAPRGDLTTYSSRLKDSTCCVELLQTKIPLFKSIVKVLGGGGGVGKTSHSIRPKLEPVATRELPPPASTAYLVISDGSCVASIQVAVHSSIATPSEITPIGTCILVEGLLAHSSESQKHSLELKAEKVLHVGTVESDKYPLSKKRLFLDTLRDISHFRPRTTTVASVMRIRSALTFGTHTFFQTNEFLDVKAPVITSIYGEGLGEKFHVTTLFSRGGSEEKPKVTKDPEDVSLEAVKAAIKEKSNLVEQFKRTESNREALAAAMQDLKKANQLALQLEEKEKQKTKLATLMRSVDGVVNFSEDFFSKPAYLTSSFRLHLESYACALGNVYSFGPGFRADRSDSAKSVAEMWMVEVEMAFSELEGAMNLAVDYFKFLCKWTLENCVEDMKFVMKRVDKNIVDRIQSIMSYSFEKITYMDAVDILKKVTEKTFEIKLEWGVALTSQHLSYLADETYKRPVIVYNYPKEVKPFYTRLNNDGKTVAAFDMVIPKVGTLVTGSQSEERFDKLIARIRELGLPREQYDWYLDLRRHGTVKHSGFSLSFDLMTLFVTGLTDVRDVIPFPRSYGKANN